MIKISIDVTKIDKSLLYKGKKGTYLNLVLFDKPDDYGNAGFAKQDLSKEQREAGVEAPIIGNWREMKKREEPQPRNRPSGPARPPVEEDDDIPF